jgi:anaerobic selenocysteine-containing dehydrogenase
VLGYDERAHRSNNAVSGRTPDRIADIWGARTPFGPGDSWPVRVDELLEAGVHEEEVTWVQSACVLCSNGCGLDIAVKDGRMVGVRGRASDRVNHGRLGPKGLHGWKANNAPDRLTQPLVRRNGSLETGAWDEALDLVVERTRQVLNDIGPLGLGFYNSGQLFLEDYYTLAVLVRAGLGTPHLDGNTRLCTATADAALKESFGCDGDPGSIEDFDLCDTLFLVGHNMAETQTVAWMRVLDRLAGPDPPTLIAVDPRRTKVAERAAVHLPIRSGTNLPLLNAIQHELIASDRIDHAFVAEHTVGYEQLVETVAEYPPERAAGICGVPAESIREAARLIGAAKRLVSTCLQGVYQSHQATASAVQVNNIHLLRGMIGKPGCAPFQMNGQPTAQNTRETGANGDIGGLRNWQNEKHVEELAQLWNVDALQIPHAGPPTHVMQIFRYAELGSIRFLWIIGTNPAVSLPNLERIRSILKRAGLFVVVSDAFLNETAELADIVLPTALWGEKTGTYTNYDRTVHLSEKAVDPPGAARSDLDILLDFARRLDLRDRDGKPLPPWDAPEGAFEAFKELTRGKLCDYSGLSYAKLRGSEGIQWPCTDASPDGTARLYTDHLFNTSPEECEDYGHDLLTGAARERKDYAELDPAGRAFLHPAEYAPPAESTRDQFPFQLVTGRTVYHWHTRTKTGRVGELNDAAPDVWVELTPEDAVELAIGEGDVVRVESPRGAIEGRARLTGGRRGVVFVPFHYGSWQDRTDREANERAANELTIAAWDPVSKQPTVKSSAVRVTRIAASGGVPAPAPTTTASEPALALRRGDGS